MKIFVYHHNKKKHSTIDLSKDLNSFSQVVSSSLFINDKLSSKHEMKSIVGDQGICCKFCNNLQRLS